MSTSELILAATDWSENARRAVQRAAYIGEQRGAQGLLMHVSSHGMVSRALSASKSEEVRNSFSKMEKLAHAVRAQTDFLFETQMHAGDVVSGIARAARVSGAQLITLGRWTDSALIRWTDTPFEKSIALRLLNQIGSPVLIVKSDPKKPYRRVLVAVGASDSAATCIEQAHAIAPDAEMVVVFAMDHALGGKTRFSEASDDRLREARVRQHEDALDRINVLLERCNIRQQQVVKVVEYGYAPKLILDKEQEFDADLLVIGRSAKSRFRRLFFGDITSQVLARSRGDVLVIPFKAKGLLSNVAVSHPGHADRPAA